MTDQNTAGGPAAGAPPAAGPTKPPLPSFAELGLRPEVMRALTDMGFTEPMEVQAATVPRVRSGRDLMIQSRTGSGKTAAFGIPLIDGLVSAEEKFVQAIILLPTRELALQVASELARIGAHSGIAVVPVYGGAPMGRQIEQLRAGGQIVCGTPGRIMDHMRRGTLLLDKVKCAILDECDEMLSMGFQEDIENILEHTPKQRQTLLFSATVPEGIQRISRRFMRDPEMVKLSVDFVGVHEIRHVYYSIPGGQRENELLRILQFENPQRAIIFCNTRDETGRVAEFLRKCGFDAEAISSDLSQTDRERVMARMRAGGIQFMVATDVAARGIDLENLSHVFNYTFPESPEVYIHRTGRTGRAGKHGTAISMIGPTEVGPFYYVKLLYKIRPEERSLPSEVEIRSRREGERVIALRAALPPEPAAEWRSLARRVMGSVDAERLIGGLLAMQMGAAAEVAKAAVARAEAAAAEKAALRHSEEGGSDAAPPPRRWESRSGERPRRGESRSGESSGPRRSESRPSDGGRDRAPSRQEPRAAERPDRAPERPQSTPERIPERAPERIPERAPERAELAPERAPERPERTRSAPPTSNGRPPAGAAPEGREFWDVWSDSGEGAPSRAPAPPAAAEGASPAPASPPPREPRRPSPAPSPEAGPGEVRLFLNLGRKDGASVDQVVALLTEHGAAVSSSQVDVMNTHSYINIPAGDAERLCAALNGQDRNGRQLLCETARPRRR